MAPTVPSLFTHSHKSGRILSALQLPYFQLRPPRDYGILTTTGHKTSKRRSRCVRVVRRGDRAYLVAIKGASTYWAKNALANPEVKLRLRGGRFSGRAREVRAEERDEAREAYSADVGLFERGEWRTWRKGKFSPEKSREMHRHWFDTGLPFVIELDDGKS
jgi:deazaflavin-dependent oxidoreductase (nitroreductase family)